jgi:hypothetical protein
MLVVTKIHMLLIAIVGGSDAARKAEAFPWHYTLALFGCGARNPYYTDRIEGATLAL